MYETFEQRYLDMFEIQLFFNLLSQPIQVPVSLQVSAIFL